MLKIKPSYENRKRRLLIEAITKMRMRNWTLLGKKRHVTLIFGIESLSSMTNIYGNRSIGQEN